MAVSLIEKSVPGFVCHLDWLAEETGRQLAGFIDARPWRHDLARRVQHYGYRYDYKARSVSADMRVGPLPAPLARLAMALCEEGWFSGVPDQVIVNEYLPGQGIAPHTDCIPCFGDIVASVSLLSSCEMEFRHPLSGQCERLTLHPGSLLVLSGPARYEWQHAIRPRKSDLIDGTRQPRQRRLSLTFRTVRLAR